MKNNKGFISMTIVYGFLIIFLFIVGVVMAAHREKNSYLDYLNTKANEDLLPNKDKSLLLFNRILEDNAVSSGEAKTPGNQLLINYSEIANGSVGNGNGLFYIDNMNVIDENGDRDASRIYFFRGTVNNYVLLRNTSTSTVYYCFRIIRTNEDQSVRLMYINQGGSNACSGINPLKNTKKDAVEYELNNWMINAQDQPSSFFVNFNEIITDSMFCKSKRDVVSNLHSFKCATAEERLYIGLPTYEDVIYAGGKDDTANTGYFMYTGDKKSYWLNTEDGTNRYSVLDNGSIKANNNDEKGIYPVISILGTSIVQSGRGTKTEPYRIYNESGK